MTEEIDHFDDEPLIFVVIGEIRQENSQEPIPFNALLAAPDDDTAVRMVLESLAQEGYAEADLHQIGNLDEEPQEDQFREAYLSACRGEVALIIYDPKSNGLEEVPPATLH